MTSKVNPKQKHRWVSAPLLPLPPQFKCGGWFLMMVMMKVKAQHPVFTLDKIPTCVAGECTSGRYRGPGMLKEVSKSEGN